MRRLEMLKKLGFEELEVEFRNVAAGRRMAARKVNESHFVILTNGSVVTLYNQYFLTKEEAREIERMANMKYKKAETIIDENSLWFQWVGYKESESK